MNIINKAYFIVLLTFLTSFGTGQGQSVFTRDQLLEDLGILWESIQKHPRVYEYTSEESFKRIYSNIESKLTDGMTADEFLKLAYPLAERIGCAHSRLFPAMSYIQNPEDRTVPFSVKFDETGIYIIKTFPENKIPIGSRLLSINGISSQELATKMTDIVSADGLKILPLKRSIAEAMFSVIYPKLFKTADEYEIKYQVYGSENTDVIIMKAYETKAIWNDHQAQDRENPFTVKYMKDNSVAVIKIKTFYFGESNEEFYEFLDNTFSKIKQEEYGYVALDLRGNGGGDPNAAARLISYIAPKPIKYFADGFGNGYPTLMKPVELSDNHFSGQLYTIIDGGGFSTAGHFVALIKYHKIGIIVGSELGSTFTCNDGSVYTTLENTELLAKIARTIYTVAVEGLKPDQGILPDYPVEFSVEAMINGVDSEMEVILDLIKQ